MLLTSFVASSAAVVIQEKRLSRVIATAGRRICGALLVYALILRGAKFISVIESKNLH